MPPKDKYTDPKLRDEIKQEVHNSGKGGKPGQWSARKAQMMASEYKKRGGEYNTSKEEGQSESQKHLENWTKEEWQTKEGEGTARQDDDSRKRYLPQKAWEEMSNEEKEETDEKKIEQSKRGKQFVGNTGEAKEARRRASVGMDQEGEHEGHQADKGHEKKEEHAKGGEKESHEKKEEQAEDGKKESHERKDEKAKNGKKDANDSKQSDKSKRQGAGSKRSAKQKTTPVKKQKDEDRMQSLRSRD